MEPLRRDEVDGIPVWWAPRPGPLEATLAFRVGLADEPFALRGITHLTEHLALFPLGRRRYEYNASVDDHDTTFDVRGSREEVAEHLRAVVAGLTNLPRDRFEDELRVLAAEGLSRTNGLPTQFNRLRFGARTYGGAAKRELGLRRITPDDVERWAAERFCKENAVLWMTGEPPADLRLDLPSGRRWPVPAAEPLPHLELPAYLRDEDQSVVVSVLGEREDFEPLRTTLAVARARLYDRLRRDCAIIYDVAQRHRVVGPGRIHALLDVEHRHEDAARVRDAVLEELRDLAERGPTAEELDFEADQTRRYAEDPASLGAHLSDMAFDELNGLEPDTPQEVLEQVRALTPERCAAAVARALRTAIVRAPEQLDDLPPGFAEYAKDPREGPPPQDGRTFVELDETECARRPCRITLGERALHWQAGDGSASMLVPFDELAGCVREAGDSHVLYTIDDTILDFSPIAFHDGDALRDALLRAVGEDRLVPLDARGRRVEAAAGRDLTRIPLLVEELYRLSRDLYEDEDLVMLAEVEDRDGPALFAVTDWRIVLHYVARGAEGDEDYRRETDRRSLSDVGSRVDDDGAGVLSFRIGDDEELTDLGPIEPQVADRLAEALGAAAVVS